MNRMLEVKNLSKTFGTAEVLKNVSFTLDEGKVLAVIGASGGGKTTLLRCLNFLERPDRGQMLVRNELIFDAANNYSETEIRIKRLRFGLVFQAFNLFPQYTALQNVTLAMKAHFSPTAELSKKDGYKKIEEQGMQLLIDVGLEDKANLYPYQLSGGQQQRVAIARALALNPDVLCFDEPTSALDPELTGEVLNVIRSLRNRNRTMVIVTHEMAFARSVADKVLFMSGGEVLEQGTAEQIFDRPTQDKTKMFFKNYLTSSDAPLDDK